MMNRLTSKISSKAQTVIPREVRERLGLKPGDLLAYRYTENGVLIEKSEAVEDDPFATFTEWASPEDDEAYRDL
jgi:antitoxin PrlF